MKYARTPLYRHSFRPICDRFTLLRYTVMACLTLLCVGIPVQPTHAHLDNQGIVPSDGSTPPITSDTVITRGQIKVASAGWHVYATTPNGEVLGVARTDAEGRFELAGQLGDNYKLDVRDVDQTPVSLPQDAIVRDIRSSHESCTAGQASNSNARAVTPTGATINGGGTLTGIVRAADSNAPLSSAIVYLYTSTQQIDNWIDSDFTGGDGAYGFKDLAPGSYYLRIEPPYGKNYRGQIYNQKTSLAAADAVAVSTGITTTVDVHMKTGGTISGRVTGSDNNAPLNNVAVWLYGPPAIIEGPCDFQARVFRDIEFTDANGVYTFTQLAVGNYYVEFDPPSSLPYASEYYNDQTKLDGATPIQLSEGTAATAIDAVLARSGAITGRVTADDSGVGLRRVYVDAFRKVGNYYAYASYGTTDASGYYTITGLTTDNYYLRINPFIANDNPSRMYVGEMYNDKRDFNQADAIAVTFGTTTSGVNVGLALGGQIRGRVTAEETGGPIAGVSIYVRDAQGSAASGSSSSYVAQTDASGVYTTTGLATGNYVVQFYTEFASGPAGDYLSEYYNNKLTDQTADTVIVTAPAATVNIDAQLSRGGTITGSVSITGGVFGSIPVTAYSALTGAYVKSTSSNSTNGNYEIRGLRSGSYKVRFGPYTTSVTVEPDCTILTTTHAEVWYDQKPDRASATLVLVNAPDVTPNINGVLGNGVVQVSKKYVYLPITMR